MRAGHYNYMSVINPMENLGQACTCTYCLELVIMVQLWLLALIPVNNASMKMVPRPFIACGIPSIFGMNPVPVE